MSPEEIKLKECPLCGGEAAIDTDKYGGSAKFVHKIHCTDCGLLFGNQYGNKRSAILRWNVRHPGEADAF